MTDWAAILRDHGPIVWQVARRLLTNDADAADCFQRTFLAAVELDRRETVRHWPAALRRLATARALETLRTRYRRRSEPLPDDATDGRTAEAWIDAVTGELADRLREALAAIDPTQAEVFCLVCLDGLPNHEAATLLGVTANNLGVLLHRARAALRDRLQAFDPAHDARDTP